MPLTPTWQTVPVFGTWRNYDGTLRAGGYKVALPVRVINTDGTVKTIFAKGQFASGTLNTTNNSLPSFTVDVPATDDPQNVPVGWQLIVEVDLGLDPFAADAPTETFVINVPLSALPDGINLADVVLPDTIPLPAPGLTKGVPGGIAALDADGDVNNAAGAKITGGGGGGTSDHGALTGLADNDHPQYTLTTRNLIAGTGLTGGGTLAADRTFTVAYGTTGTTAAAGNDARLSDARTPTAHAHGIGDLTTTGTPSGTTFLRGDGTWSTPPGGGVTASQITDSTAVGRAVITAADAAAGRTAIGAGTSSLAIGTTSSTAAAGDDSRLTDQRTPLDGSVTNVKVDAAAAIELSKLAVDPLARGNHTGTQAIATVTDLQTSLDAKVPETTFTAELRKTDCVIRWDGTGSQPLRVTGTTDTLRRVRWVQHTAPPETTGYAIDGLDVWEETP